MTCGFGLRLLCSLRRLRPSQPDLRQRFYRRPARRVTRQARALRAQQGWGEQFPPQAWSSTRLQVSRRCRQGLPVPARRAGRRRLYENKDVKQEDGPTLSGKSFLQNAFKALEDSDTESEVEDSPHFPLPKHFGQKKRTGRNKKLKKRKKKVSIQFSSEQWKTKTFFGNHDGNLRVSNPEIDRHFGRSWFWPRNPERGELLIPPAKLLTSHQVCDHYMVALGQNASVPHFLMGRFNKPIKPPGLTCEAVKERLKQRYFAETFVYSNVIGVKTHLFLKEFQEWADFFEVNGDWCFLKRATYPMALVRLIVSQALRAFKAFWMVDNRHPVLWLQKPKRIMYVIMQKKLLAVMKHTRTRVR